MGVTRRTFPASLDHGVEFARVRDFLIELDTPHGCRPGFSWVRWEWAFARAAVRAEDLGRIGLWERGGRLVALATLEDGPGEAWLLARPGFEHLYPELIEHARRRLARDGRLRVLVPEDDDALVSALRVAGFRPGGGGEPNSVLDLTGAPPRCVPEGYEVRTLAEPWDVRAFHRLLHRGFGHPGEPDCSARPLAERRRMTSAPSQIPELNVLVVAPDGSYAAYCGAWTAPGTGYAVVEPVCTDPAHRRRGGASAAVLTALAHARALGAETAYVGSDLPVYRSLGFRPALGGAWWDAG